MKTPKSIWQKLGQLEGNRELARKRPEHPSKPEARRNADGRKWLAGKRIKTPLQETIDAFWSMINTGQEGDCWNWMAGKNPGGYGNFWVAGTTVTAHRMAFALWNDRDPKEWVLHRCDNRQCCNPAHLFEGNVDLNNKDCLSKGRRNSRRGEDHQDCKLSDADIEEISNMILRRGMYDPIIKKYGVTYRTIWAISRGKYIRSPRNQTTSE